MQEHKGRKENKAQRTQGRINLINLNRLLEIHGKNVLKKSFLFFSYSQ